MRAVPLEQAAAAEMATDRVKVDAWYRESVLSPDFLDKNFLSDDRRYPVYQLGTNIARAAGDQRQGAGRSGRSSRQRPTSSCRRSAQSRGSTIRAIPTSRSSGT